MKDEQVPAREMYVQEIRLEGENRSSKWMEVQNIFSTEVSKRHHDHPEIVKAKKEEIRRWKEYDTVDQVSQTSEMQVLSSSRVVTVKDGGLYKALYHS